MAAQQSTKGLIVALCCLLTSFKQVYSMLEQCQRLKSSHFGKALMR